MTEFAPHSDPHRLTARQREVLKLVAAGRTNAEIGEALGISFETAKMHVGDILDRLGVDSREEAAQIWREYRRPAARIGRALSGFALTPLQRVGGMVAGVATVAAVGLVFVGLARDDRDPGASIELIGTRWDLLSVDGQPLTPSRSSAYLLLRDEEKEDNDGPIGVGDDGCNGFVGGYSISGRQLVIGELTRTLVGCPGPEDSPDKRFNRALSAGTFEIDQSGNLLTLIAANAARLEFIARTEGVPGELLTTIRWQVTNLDGRKAAFGEAVIIDFADDSTFSAATSCGFLRGSFERTDTKMTITVEGETPADCAEPGRTLDANLRAALAETTSFTIGRSVLSLIRAEGSVTLSKLKP